MMIFAIGAKALGLKNIKHMDAHVLSVYTQKNRRIPNKNGRKKGGNKNEKPIN